MKEDKINALSRVIGVMECFNEVIACGVKNLALGVPVYDKQERERHIIEAERICNEKGTHFFIEDYPFLTDLFPISLNQYKYNLVFYRQVKYLEEYLNLKNRKKDLIAQNKYSQEEREKIAYDFGKLLSYSDEDIFRMINENQEKEKIHEEAEKINFVSQVTFLYFDDLARARSFFQETMGLEIAIDQGEDYCTIFRVSKGAFLGIVDREKGSVKATRRDGVLFSFVVDDAGRAYEQLKNKNLAHMTPLKTNHEINIQGFQFTGPEGYRFEVEAFLKA